ncbi:MAG TPA: pseudouridine synthase [Planctomycetota bacterium]|nr:pseudouridine synthase [Planctomycetota bacterium]
MDPARRRLVEHVLDVQRTIRTCERCGECCTDRHNTVRILPAEAERIAEHLRGAAAARRAEFEARLAAAVERYRLKPGDGAKRYTCPFLEEDRSCALPFDVKPTACLSFNPLSPDRCDMQSELFDAAHAAVEAANAAAAFVRRRVAIPVGVQAALAGRSPRAAATPPPEAVAAAPARRPGKPPPAPPSGGIPTGPILLPRLLSKLNVASRKKAEELVRDGRVRVDGVVRRDVLFKVDPRRAAVSVDGAPIDLAAAMAKPRTFVVVNKPRGLVTTLDDPEGRPTVAELVKEFAVPGLAPVGRLDYASAGLLLFTDDHALADRLLDPRTHVPKTYRVRVRGVVSEETLRRLRTETVRDGDDVFLPPEAAVVSQGKNSTWLDVTLRQGRNRQLRRQFAHFGHEVETLIRTGFGPLTLGDLAPGAARALDDDEIAALRAAPGRTGFPV